MFTKVMTTRLIELIKERTDELFPTSRKANAAAVQFAAWEEITRIINAEFPENLKTLKQVQCKWKNIRQEVKDDIARIRRRCRSNFRVNNTDTSEVGSTRSASPGDGIPADQLTLFLQNVLRTQNSLNAGGEAALFDVGESMNDDDDCNQALTYNEAGTSSNSPLVDERIFAEQSHNSTYNDRVRQYPDSSKENLAHSNGVPIPLFNQSNNHKIERRNSASMISDQNLQDDMEQVESASSRKRKFCESFLRGADMLNDDDDLGERQFNRELRKVRLEQEKLKRDILHERLASEKKLSNMWSNANKFLCTAVTFMEQLGERFAPDNNQGRKEKSPQVVVRIDEADSLDNNNTDKLYADGSKPDI